MRSLLRLICLWLFSFSLQAQTGTYFLSHYTPPDDRIDFRSVDIVQDEQGEIYFATKSGVLEFDGKNWRLISVPGAVHALTTRGADVFAASLTGIGKLGAKSENPRPYQSIASGFDFFSTLSSGETIFFCNKDQLVSYSIAQNTTNWILKADSTQGNFLGIYEVNGNTYIGTSKRGLLKAEGQKLIASDITPGNLVFSTPSLDRKKFLVGMNDHRVFVHESNALHELIIKDQEFLTRNILVNGVWVTDSLIALGTLRGGVLFVNAKTGVTEQIIDYFSGLPDNEVYALMTDRSQGVWVAHEYGFTRIAPGLPFRSFDHFPGLEGNLLCAQSYQGKVFVGTTLGLFQLEKVGSEISENILPPQAGGKKKKGTSKQKAEVSPVPIIKKDSVTSSDRFSYRKVTGIDGKVTQLEEINGKLLASGMSGLYEVDGLKSSPILQEPVRSVFFSPLLQQLFIGTYAERLKTFELAEGGWHETNLVDTLNDFISHTFEDRLENIWLCGRTKIYKIETIDGDITDVVSFPINNPSRDETVGLAYGNELYIAASGQFSRYDGKSSFVKFDSLPGPRKYFATGGYFWFHDGTKWRTVDRRMQSLKLEWLGLFPNLRYLAPDNQKNSLWVITAANELYKFSSSSSAPNPSSYPLFLRGVRGQEKEVKLAQRIEVEQNDGSVTFEFIQPDFVGLNTTQYRYQVKGLHTPWSFWSATNNIITFSYLPAGKYLLAVQSRDLLGNESSVEQLDFRVLPPYWQRWWFYALEFTVFSGLVILSLRLARANSRYRYISQILSLLTVVMLIQFLQTVLASLIGFKTSPVIDFIIQVFIALVVFPVEIFARNAMMKYSQGKYQITRAWDKKDQLEG
jgi:hypothetical protein